MRFVEVRSSWPRLAEVLDGSPRNDSSSFSGFCEVSSDYLTWYEARSSSTRFFWAPQGAIK